MAELDHLVVASADLAAGVAHVRDLTGVEAAPGGPHPGVGTHNALLTFDEQTYFEIIAIDPDQPEPTGPRPFGLSAGSPPRLAGFAIHPVGSESIDEVVATMTGVGFDPGPVRSMSRVRPDGTEIAWRLTLSNATSGGGGGLPFVIDWGGTPSPATSLPSMGDLVEVRVTTDNPLVRAVLEALALAKVVIADGPPALVAVVDSPKGRIELR